MNEDEMTAEAPPVEITPEEDEEIIEQLEFLELLRHSELFQPRHFVCDVTQHHRCNAMNRK